LFFSSSTRSVPQNLVFASSSFQVHTFYEAVGYMIAAQPNKPTQERLIAKLMEMPNNAVRLSPSFFFLSF
jgi:hypothetical protein